VTLVFLPGSGFSVSVAPDADPCDTGKEKGHDAFFHHFILKGKEQNLQKEKKKRERYKTCLTDLNREKRGGRE
jgi:hypothetical protein